MSVHKSLTPFSFCHYCGHSMNDSVMTENGPQCSSCKRTTWMNVPGVAGMIIPTGNNANVFGVRRAQEPFINGLALPSGFLIHTKEVQETWQEGGLREAYEEINVSCQDLDAVEHVLTESSHSERAVGDRLLVIGSYPRVPIIKPFVPNPEISERVELTPDMSEQLCFSIHRRALALYWDKLGVSHNVQV